MHIKYQIYIKNLRTLFFKLFSDTGKHDVYYKETERFLPSITIGADGYCRRSLRPAGGPSVCPSVCLSVRPERRYHFEIFHDTPFWPGLRDDVTTLTLQGFQMSAWNLVVWCTVTWSRSLCKVAMLDQFSRVPRKILQLDKTRSEGRRYLYNSLGISVISLNSIRLRIAKLLR